MNTVGSDSSSQSWFRSANCDAGYGAALLGAVALLLALSATGGWGREYLRYQREALAHYQWWRLISAHLVHLGWRHALLNCGGLAAVWVLFAREFPPRRWLWIVLLAYKAASEHSLWAAWRRLPELARVAMALLAFAPWVLDIVAYDARWWFSDTPFQLLTGALGGLGAGALLLPLLGRRFPPPLSPGSALRGGPGVPASGDPSANL